MGRTYNVVDADAHVLEPPNFWADYIDPAYKGRVPELIVDTDGKERLRIEDTIYGGAKGLGFAGAIGARQGETPTDIKYIEGRKGGFDPHARIPDMDLDNIDAAYLYPTLGCYRVESKTQLWPPPSAGPITAGWPTTASRIPTVFLAWQCCPCKTLVWQLKRCATLAKTSA